MSKKRYRPEEIVNKLREADVLIGQGQTVALIEDTTTTGGSTLEALEIVERAGGKVARVLCLVERGEGAAEAFAERGVQISCRQGPAMGRDGCQDFGERHTVTI